LNVIKSVGNAITKVNRAAAKFAAFLIFPLIFIITFEVFMRFVLSMPTKYSYDLAWMMYATLVFLGGGYVLAQNKHVRADVFYEKLKRRGKMIVNVLCYPVFFFTSAGALVYSTFRLAKSAWIYGETGFWTDWQVPIAPIRTVLFLSMAMLAFQGIVKFFELFKKPEEGGLTEKSEGGVNRNDA